MKLSLSGVAGAVNQVKSIGLSLSGSYRLMSRAEKVLAIIFILLSLGLVTYKYESHYMKSTTTIPSSGGEYVENSVGDIKYINPVLAQTDLEKSLSKLLYSGLVRVEGQDKIVPDLAQNWEVSSDGMTYTFKLKKDLLFSDGVPVTSADIIHTVNYIKTPEVKSSLAKTFEGVAVTAPDKDTVVFVLPKPFGPFLYSCNFGVLPAHLSPDEFQRQFTGSGPYQFVKSVKDGNRINEVSVKLNDNYHGTKPYIEKIRLKLFTDELVARTDYETNRVSDALFGVTSGVGNKHNYSSSRRLGLIFNLRSEKLKDKALRQKIAKDEKIDQPLSLTLVTLDSPQTKQKAEELKQRFAKSNVSIDIQALSTTKLQEAMTAKGYDLLLYGFDFGYDRDPYKFWHSSQLDAQNYAGWSDKNSDILLEDARMVLDITERNRRYDQFYEMVKNEALAEFYTPIEFAFEVKDRIKNVAPVVGSQVYSRFTYQNLWYIEEARVKK
ncbi:MAG TPA: ABC transporter substrate-binding protein [bacterium]|mgnify:CR=1 FL=1|nr:ABC transporter substrate-binding protein [bacterium]